MFTDHGNLIERGLLVKTLSRGKNCEFKTASEFECKHVKILASQSSKRKTYQLLQIEMDPVQNSSASPGKDDIKINSFEIALVFSSSSFVVCFTFIKLFFFLSSIFCFVQFHT